MKKYILGLLTGIIIVGSIGVVAYQMNATQITYEPKDKSWKVKTVKEAVDDVKITTNKFSELNIIVGASSISTYLVLSAFELEGYADKYKYFRIEDVYSKTPSTNQQCTLTLVVPGNEENVVLNSQYKTKDYSQIYVKASSTSNNSWNNCVAKVNFYNAEREIN